MNNNPEENKPGAVLNQASIQELLNLINERNEISLKKDDPLLILVTVFEFIMQRSNDVSMQNIDKLQSSLFAASGNFEQNFLAKLENFNIMLNDTAAEKIKTLLIEYNEEYSKNIEKTQSSLTQTFKQIEAKLNKKARNLTMLSFLNLVTAGLVMSTFLVFTLKFL